MNIYEINDIAKLIEGNSYVGRGIVIGKSADGKKACSAYFIMGRSANSRNRIFAERDGVLYTEPFDASKVEDPSLIIYAAVREYENKLIVTNGDQTDTIYNGLAEGKCFASALKSRKFEPDAPNLTPRISGMLSFENGDFTEASHRDCDGDTGILEILRAYHDCGFEGYIRPDHGRHLWGEGPGTVRPGYGLYDRALGIMYMLGVWDLLDRLAGKN